MGHQALGVQGSFRGSVVSSHFYNIKLLLQDFWNQGMKSLTDPLPSGRNITGKSYLKKHLTSLEMVLRT